METHSSTMKSKDGHWEINIDLIQSFVNEIVRGICAGQISEDEFIKLYHSYNGKPLTEEVINKFKTYYQQIKDHTLTENFICTWIAAWLSSKQEE